MDYGFMASVGGFKGLSVLGLMDVQGWGLWFLGFGFYGCLGLGFMVLGFLVFGLRV